MEHPTTDSATETRNQEHDERIQGYVQKKGAYEQYIQTGGRSEEEIRAELKSSGYSDTAIDEAIADLPVSWNAQAYQRAQLLVVGIPGITQDELRLAYLDTGFRPSKASTCCANCYSVN